MKTTQVVPLVRYVAIVAWTFAVHAEPSTNAPLKLIQSIPLPGVATDFDHFAVDLRGNRLFSCAEKSGTVEVFNMDTNQHIQTIGKGMIREPHSLLIETI